MFFVIIRIENYFVIRAIKFVFQLLFDMKVTIH